MASTYTANSGIEKPGSGEQSGTWGTTTNTNFDIIDRVLNGVGTITLTGTTTTLTTSDGSLSDGHYKVLILAGSPSGTNTVTISPNDQDKLYLVNNTTNQSVIFTQGSGGNITITAGGASWIYADGAGSGAQVRQLPSDVVGDTSPQLGGDLDTNGNNINFADNDKAQFGAGNDLQIFHDSGDSYIADTGTGDLRIRSNGTGVSIQSNAGENMGTFTKDGAVELYYDNSKKIETTSAGVDVTGTVQGDSFTLDNGSNDWTVTVSSNKLRFNYAGTAKMELDTSGNLKVVGDVTAFGSI